MTKDKMNILICFWNAIGIFIIAGFFLYGFMIGGSASLGYCDANAYYVGNHGEYTQVSEIIYHVSYVWEILFWIFLTIMAETPTHYGIVLQICWVIHHI